MPKRLRLQLQSTVIPRIYTKRPKEYLDLRYWWLHELRRLRAARRINGIVAKRDIKVAQKELARIRRDHK